MKKILVFILMILVLPFASGCRLNTLSLKEEYDIGESIPVSDVILIYVDQFTPRKLKSTKVVLPIKDINNKNYEYVGSVQLTREYFWVIDKYTRLIELDSMSLYDFEDNYYNEDVILIESIEEDKRLTCYITKDNDVYIYSHKDKTDKVYKNYDENTLYDNLTQTVRLGDLYSRSEFEDGDVIGFMDLTIPIGQLSKVRCEVFDEIKEYIIDEIFKEDEIFVKLPVRYTASYMTSVGDYYNRYTAFAMRFYSSISKDVKHFYDKYQGRRYYPFRGHQFSIANDNTISIIDSNLDYLYISRLDYLDFYEMVRFANYDTVMNHYTNEELLEKFGK